MELWRDSIVREELQDYLSLFRNPSKLIISIQLISILSVIPVGYHMIALNVPADVIQESMKNHSSLGGIAFHFDMHLDVLWAIIVASQAVGAFVGCFYISGVERKWGTKRGLMVVNNVILIIASILLFMSQYYLITMLLILGRFLIGIYTGFACALVPIFIQELSPKERKGALSCFVHIGVCAGAALGGLFSIDFLLGNASTWHLLLAFPGIIAIGLIIYSQFLPDCPNYLLQRGEHATAAEAIRFFYDVDEENDDAAILQYKQVVTQAPKQISLNAAFYDPQIRTGVFLGMLVSAAQILSGCMATVSYSTSMFEKVAFMSIIIPFIPALGSVFSILLTLPALRFVKTVPRKELLIDTLIICAIANYLMMITTLISENVVDGTWASVAFGFTFIILGVGYNVGVGPVSYFIPGELVPAKAAGIAYSCSVAINWLVTMITNFIYYPLFQAAGGWSYLIFAIPTTITVIIIKYYLPEDAGVPTPPAEKLVLMCNVQQDYFDLMEDEERRVYGTFDSGLGDEVSLSTNTSQIFH
uniref:MFS domain-containing protein n=1 Tax=Panagrellus redivivus TaxID=6233 RepID=A0A7E4VRI5_PANRE